MANMTANSASMKGMTPRVTSSIFMRPTPATTLSTVPTGGVIPFMLAEFAVMFLMVLFPPLVTVPAKWFTG